MRERTEQLAQEDLARSISRLSTSQRELRKAEAAVEQAMAEHRSAPGGTIDGPALMARQAFLERTEARRRRREAALARSEAEVAERNAKLATAASEHEALERLRERRRLEHEREQSRLENNVNDEIASVRFGRSPVA